MILVRNGLLCVFCIVLAACGGGGGAGTRGALNAQTDAQQNGPPAVVTLTASSSVVKAGAWVTLTWSSSNAQSCEASGGWSGAKALSGSQSVGPIKANTTFTLSCSGSGGGGVRQVQVQVNKGSGVAVSLTAMPDIILASGTTTLVWSSDNATSCSASSAWSGTRPLKGNFVTAPATQDATYRLQCDGPSGSAIAMVTVRVGDKTLRWRAPTQNVDGSGLVDLAGYRIYWGSHSRNYRKSVAIKSASTTQWVATTGTGEFYFALTAIDADGNESGYSNEVRKLIP